MEKLKRFCPWCGTELPENALFCISCGAKFEDDSIAESVSSINTAEQKREEAPVSAEQETPRTEERSMGSGDFDEKTDEGQTGKKKKRIPSALLIVIGVVLLAVIGIAVYLGINNGNKLSEQETALLGRWDSYTALDLQNGASYSVPGYVTFDEDKTAIMDLGEEGNKLTYHFMWEYDSETEEATTYNLFFQEDMGLTVGMIFHNAPSDVSALNGKLMIYLNDGAYALVFYKAS